MAIERSNRDDVPPGFWGGSWAECTLRVTLGDGGNAIFLAVTQGIDGKQVAVACSSDAQAITNNERLFVSWKNAFGGRSKPKPHGKRVHYSLDGAKLLAENLHSFARSLGAGQWPGVAVGSYAWIDDIVMNAFGRALLKEHGGANKIYIFNCNMIKMLLDKRTVSRWGKGTAWPDMKCIFFPHNPGNHWVLYAIKPEQKQQVTVLFKDSLHGAVDDDIVAALKIWYNTKVEDSGDDRTWTTDDNPGPLQVGCEDCGIFAMVAMYQSASKRRFNFSQAMVGKARQWALAYIINAATVVPLPAPNSAASNGVGGKGAGEGKGKGEPPVGNNVSKDVEDDGGAGPAKSGGSKKADAREAMDEDEDDVEDCNAADDKDASRDNDAADDGQGSALLLQQASLERDREDMTDPDTYKVGEVVWVKMASFQYWPSIVTKVSGKKGKKGKAKLYFNAINDGPEDKQYSIDLIKVGKSSGGKPPARDVQRFKGATMQEFYDKALSCRTLKAGGVRDEALLEGAFKRAKRIIQAQASRSGKDVSPSKRRKVVLEAVPGGHSADFNGADKEPLTADDKEILRLRAPFENSEACVQALREAEGTIRGIVAGKVPCELFDRYKRGGSNFQNTPSTGPFKDEDKQIEPLIDVLGEWFPGRDHFKLCGEVLLEEALLLIVQNFNHCSEAEARTFIEDKQWMTSRERGALGQTCRMPADDAPDSGEDSVHESDDPASPQPVIPLPALQPHLVATIKDGQMVQHESVQHPPSARNSPELSSSAASRAAGGGARRTRNATLGLNKHSTLPLFPK